MGWLHLGFGKRRATDRLGAGEISGHDAAAAPPSLMARLAQPFRMVLKRWNKAEATITDGFDDPFLDAALTAMRTMNVKPTPAAYTLFYTHVSGERLPLSEEIRRLKTTEEPVTPVLVAEMYERHFGAEQVSQTAYEASRNVERLLGVVHETLTSAGDSTADHGERISALHDELKQQDKVAEIRRVVESILSETASMRRSITKLERRVVHSAAEIASLRDHLEQVQRASNSDPLTGVGNRKALEMELKRAARDSIASKKPFSLLMVDIDHLRLFNEEFGPQIGDDALKLVARTLSSAVKGRDLVARFGGEEFGVVLAETPLEGAMKLAEILRGQVESVHVDGKDTTCKVRPVTISIGVAQYREPEPLKRVVGRADRALHRAKEEGRNLVLSERDIEVHGRPKKRSKTPA
ncbi:MAG: diguanylate cyclase [Geminicoccaceae bacterium]|nr:diguanylate cyclase [Geminicoccaceae bacterium]MCB9944679.1 diguanylate cyclase [Geminicoccaceae bacterium]